MQLASWAYETNITDFNEANATKAGLKYNQILSGLIEESKFYQPNDARQKRLLSVLKSQGNGIPTSVQDQNALAQTLTTLTSIYSTAKHDGMALEPELTEVLAESRDYDELLDAYIGWRNVTGPKMKDLYVKFVELYNKGARDTGYDDAGKMWRSGYDMPVHDFENLIETTWQQVLPLYEQLHCYAGQKLAEKYGADKVLGKDGLLPAHLFGNMWSQDWIYISDLLKPFPDVPPLGDLLL